MFFTNFSFLAVALLAIVHLCKVTAIPVDSLSLEARKVLARATPAAPRFAVYSDKYIGTAPPAASSLTGYNVFILSFLLIEGAWDNVQVWTALTAAQRSSIKAEYAAAGISLMASAFGSSDAPTSSGYDPITLANTMSSFIIQYDLDGIDVDYEDFNAMNAQNGSAENWLISFTQQLRVNLPQGQYIVTHAPVAPWFDAGYYASGAYITVDRSVGSLIDWYNVQFYNQNQYTTCSDLLDTSLAPFTNTALFQIAAAGVSLNKLVIGKPGTTADANNGYIDPTTLAGCLSQAKAQGWSGGAMVWQYPDANSSWITTVRSQSWPV